MYNTFRNIISLIKEMIKPKNQELNEYMIPTDSPLAGTNPINSGYTFNTQNERGVISNYNVRNLSFSKAVGGTLTLGGTNNGNGVLNVQNQAGSNVVTLDKSGVTVTNGSISIQNSAGSTIIDSNGLVSNTNANFENSSTNGVMNNITSASYVDVTNSSMTTSNFTRSKRVLLTTVISTYLDRQAAGDFGGRIVVTIDIDGVNILDINHQGYSIAGDGSAADILTGGGGKIVTLGTGTHVIKLKVLIVQLTGNTVGFISGYNLDYVVLGN